MVEAAHCAVERRSPSRFRGGVAAAALAALGLVLASCASTPQGSVGAVRGEEEREPPARPQTGARPGLTPPFLEGKPVQRVGVLLNFSALPQESEGLYNAAELSLFEENDPALLMIPRDAGSGAGGAAAAAQALGADGAEVIIGPLLRDSVLGARDAARSADAPMLAFSNDRAVAGSGAFLLSFQSEEEVARIVTFAVQQGLRRIAVLTPDSEYGRRADAEARRAAQLAGGQVVAGQLYTPTAAGAAQAAALLATPALSGGAQAVLIPGEAAAAAAAAQALAQAGLDGARVRILGVGSWNLGSGFRQPALAGAWVAAVDPTARREFERRYRAAYGREPIRLASLAYDAMKVAARVARAPDREARAVLQQVEGFQGADGLFRFRADGTIERALPVFQVRPDGGFAVLEAAPTRFPPPGV